MKIVEETKTEESPPLTKKQKKEEPYVPTNYYLRHHKNLKKVKDKQQLNQEEEFKEY